MSELPRITPTTLRASQQCALRFHRLVNGAGRVRGDPRRRFALPGAITQACRDAHQHAQAQGCSVAGAADHAHPPEDLTPEERHAFAHAVATYAAVADAREGTYHAEDHERFPNQESSTGRFEIMAPVDLVLRHREDRREVRELALREAPEPLADSSRVVLAALALRAPLTYAHCDLRTGTVVEATLEEPDRRTLGADLQRRVMGALGVAQEPIPTPGRWCSGCEVLRTCPAVVHTTAEELRAGGST